MLDRAKFENNYNESGEFDWQALSALELRLIKHYRRMSVEDQNYVSRMSEILLETPDCPGIDKAIT